VLKRLRAAVFYFVIGSDGRFLFSRRIFHEYFEGKQCSVFPAPFDAVHMDINDSGRQGKFGIRMCLRDILRPLEKGELKYDL